MYTPHTWNPGVAGDTLITAVKLNELEQGVVQADVTNPASQAAIALAAEYVPAVKAQQTENTAIEVFHIQPVTAGNEPFQVQENSFVNVGGGAGTYNHGTWIGWNAARHSGATPTTGKPAMIMGIEDNYFDAAVGGSQKYGPEWYVEYWSPDGTSQTMLRPFYARMEGSNSNTSSNMTILQDIGSDGTGQWQVMAEGMGARKTLLLATSTTLQFGVDATLRGNTLDLAPLSGQALFRLNSSVPPALEFLNSGAVSWVFQSASGTSFVVGDANGRTQITLTEGTTVAAALADFNSGVKVEGVLTAGTATATPTVAVTANLGGTPPAPTVVGNASRGTITFGTGTTPAAGVLMTVTLPAGYTGTPVVVISPSNYATAGANLFVTPVNATTFQIGSGNTLAASQAGTVYELSYMVMG